MSRSRNIKPGFFKNDLLAECHPLARILFAGLWCEADREGRLEDRPARIKAECLPYDDCDVNGLLASLSERGFITRYTVNGKKYIAINRFLTHQNPHKREVPSSIPANSDARHDLGNAEAQPCTGSARLIPDSPFLIPDSIQEQKPSRAGFVISGDSNSSPTAAGRACQMLKAAGCSRVNPSHPNLLAAINEGVSGEVLVDTYRENPTASNPFAWAIATARSRHADGAKQITLPNSRGGPPSAKLGKTAQAIQALEDMKHGNRLGIGRDFDGNAEANSALIGKHAGS